MGGPAARRLALLARPDEVPLSTRALAALDRLPARLDTPLPFPATPGGYIGLDTWRTREWYPALEAGACGPSVS